MDSPALHTKNTVRNISKIAQIEKFVLCTYLSKKAAVVSNFCLIGKISHNFLVPRMIELHSLQDFHVYSNLRSTQSERLARSYTHSVLIRNGPIRHTSEIFRFFKK